MAEMQPTIVEAEIPIDPNVRLLSNAIKQGDRAVGVYIVGGAVRDYLFHKHQGSAYKPKDVDLTTNLSEKEILQRLRSPSAIQQGISVHEKESVDTFGVVFASINGENYEVAPFRKDIGIADGRHPDHIECGTIYDDAARRDLTINNLYYDFDNKVILDFNPNGQGLEDIKNGVARPVGNPFERFNEDKLRILRLVRFFSRFNTGSIRENSDSQTLAAIEQFRNLREQGISPERIFMEFMAGIKQSLNTTSFLKNLVELGLIDQVFQNLQVNTMDMHLLGNVKNPKVVLTWLLQSNYKIATALNALKYPNDISEAVQFLIEALTFNHINAPSVIRNRDRRLLNSTAVGAGNQPMSPQEIAAHNEQMIATTVQDLNDLALIVENPQIGIRLRHLSSYQAPNASGEELMRQGFKGAAIGAEQRRLISEHYQQSFADWSDS